MKIVTLTFATLLAFSTPSFSAISGGTISHTMNCTKVFGNPIFTSVEIKFTTAAKGDADRPVDILVNYKYDPNLDSADRFTKPFVEKSTVHQVSGYGIPQVEINFDDTTYGDNDYSGGSIKFDEDDNLGLLAIVKYSSDGPSYFGILSCEEAPHFSW
jgi:hypothetical protein